MSDFHPDILDAGKYFIKDEATNPACTDSTLSIKKCPYRFSRIPDGFGFMKNFAINTLRFYSVMQFTM